MFQFDIVCDDHGIGDVLILKEPTWSNEIATYMLDNNIHALRLSDSAGFRGGDISFIKSLGFLKSLELYCWDAKQVKEISNLSQLEVVGLQFKSTQKIDFSSFNNLRVAKVTWAKGLSSLLQCKTIEELNIQNYPLSDLRDISHMSELRKLFLTSRKLESLQGIEQLSCLEELDLYNCQKLTSIESSKECPRLVKVEIEACNKICA